MPEIFLSRNGKNPTSKIYVRTSDLPAFSKYYWSVFLKPFFNDMMLFQPEFLSLLKLTKIPNHGEYFPIR